MARSEFDGLLVSDVAALCGAVGRRDRVRRKEHAEDVSSILEVAVELVNGQTKVIAAVMGARV